MDGDSSDDCGVLTEEEEAGCAWRSSAQGEESKKSWIQIDLGSEFNVGNLLLGLPRTGRDNIEVRPVSKTNSWYKST